MSDLDLYRMGDAHLSDIELSADLKLASTAYTWFKRLDHAWVALKQERDEAREKLAAALHWEHEKQNAPAKAEERLALMEIALHDLQEIVSGCERCSTESDQTRFPLTRYR
jgi:hypothetical protein